MGLYSLNCDTFILAYIAILKTGAAVVPVNVLLTPQALGKIFNDAQIRALIVHSHYAGALSTLRDTLPDLEFCLAIGDPAAPSIDAYGQTPSPMKGHDHLQRYQRLPAHDHRTLQQPPGAP